MQDLLIYENGSGGDLFVSNGDISGTDFLTQQVYLSLFGGNIESSTRGDEAKRQLRFDWWGNSFQKEKSKYFNSETEKTLNNTALNSNGRILILTAVKNDLKFLKNLLNLQIDVRIPSNNEVEIYVKMVENGKNIIIKIIWDKMKKEPIIEKLI